MLTVERGTARAYTRNGHDTSDRYARIIASARKLPCRSAILDGEVIVQDARGLSDFEALHAAPRSQSPPPTSCPCALLRTPRKCLRGQSLSHRRPHRRST